MMLLNLMQTIVPLRRCEYDVLKTWGAACVAVLTTLLVSQLALANHGVAPIPYTGTPDPRLPRIGTGVPTPQQVTGKEFSDGRDRDFLGDPDLEQVIAWDGLGGVRDSFDYSGSRGAYPEVSHDIEVDAIANGGDALFQPLRDNQASMLFSVEADANIYYVRPTGFPGATPGHGIWATPAEIDAVHPPLDVDGLEVWGPDQLDDADRYSLRGDDFTNGVVPNEMRKVAIWEYDAANNVSVHHTLITDLAAAMDLQFGGPGEGGPLWGQLVELMDVDAIMTLGLRVTYSIAPLDLTFADPQLPPQAPRIFHGGEIFEYDGDPTVPTRYLMMGGYIWDHNFDLMAEFGVASNNLNALEAVAIPEPSTIALMLLGLLAAARFVRRR